ncbi:hypothetical protein QQ008_19740 [Fulvivirgaceae bacterium BMA10]|uniref:Uncharacterized protein n=1 Tax=Splendidivirga corallicola TaxID=3051826 RepID=A0ABT8KS86_9BACT|nr:hypothetical protein [Fulvivirgaceae bacterium BMA10]
MKAIFTLVFVLVHAIVFSQGSTSADAQQNIYELGEDNTKGIVRIYDNRYQGVKGSPYLYPSWSQGKVKLEGEEIVGEAEIKLNLYQNDLIYKNSATKKVLAIDNASEFTINNPRTNKELIFEKVQFKLGKNKEMKGYLEVLYSNQVMLYKRYKVKFIKADFQGAYSSGRKYDEFKRSEELYVKDLKGKFWFLKPSKKRFQEIFSDKSSELKSLFRKDKLILTDEKAILEVIKYYESLH